MLAYHEKEVNQWNQVRQEALALADGTVVKVVDRISEQVPGDLPEGIGLEEVDGDSVILDIGGGNYANYAHFQPGSIRVKEGDRVRRGDVLALVGNSGNSTAPHLHFHVMDGPLLALGRFLGALTCHYPLKAYLSRAVDQ